MPDNFFNTLFAPSEITPYMVDSDELNFFDCDDEEIEEENESLAPVIYRYHSPSRPSLYFCGSENPRDLYLGIELEFDTRNPTVGHRMNKYSLIEGSNHIWGNSTYIYYMLDSSLQRGLEMITQPATYVYHFDNMDRYKELFELILKKGFKSQSLKNCGYHIHFNKLYFGDGEEYDKNVSNLLFIADKFWREIVLCSRRDYASLIRWADKFNKKPQDVLADYKQFEQSAWGTPHREKYHAINLVNRNTIEFRMYRGTLDINDFFATLELTKNIIETAKRFTEEEISEMDFSHFIRTSDNLFKYYKKCNRKTALERLPDELK